MYPVETPFKIYTGLDGKALQNGYVYFGLPGQNPITAPVTVYWDAAGTQPAVQPLRTTNGYIVRAGTPANVFFSGSYSELVQDSKQRQVFYARTSDEFATSSAVVSLIATLAASTGAGQIGYIQPGATGAVATTVEAALSETVSVFRFMTAAQIADVKANTMLLDVTAAIQATIDYAIYLANPRIGEIEFPPGSYKTSTTLHVGYGTSFTRLTLKGAGSSYNGEAAFGGSRIVPTFSDRPAINVQGARRTRIRGLAIIGLNNAYVIAQGLGGLAPLVDDTDVAVWASPSLSANATSRYAPYAGITVDAYSGGAPVPAYPAVSYPAFLGAVGQYNKSFSSVVTIEDCYIAGFVAGVVVQPCSADGNGDYVSLRDSVITNSVYGISVGNGQARNTSLYNSQIANVHTALANNKHGMQRGKFGGVVSGCEIGACIQYFDINTGFCGPMLFEGCYGELIWRLGNTNLTAAGSNPIMLNSCELAFSNSPAIRGVPKQLIEGGSNVVRSNGGFWTLPSVLAYAGTMSINGTLIVGADMGGASAARALAQRSSGGILPIGSQIILDESTEVRTSVPTGQISLPKNSPGAGRTKTIGRLAQSIQFRESSNNAPPLPCNRLVQSANRASAPLAIVGISGTIDFSATPQSYGTVRAGDLVQDDVTGTIFLCTSYVGLVASVTALNNYYNPGGGNVLRTAIAGAGNWYILSGRYYGTSYPLYGDTTAASAVITNCNRGDGYGGFIGTDLAVGDYLLQGTWLSGLFANGTTILAIDAGLKTITMSANANTTASKQPFHFWVQG